jgi:3-hydroxybutyryl-CoA dehydratase
MTTLFDALHVGEVFGPVSYDATEQISERLQKVLGAAEAIPLSVASKDYAYLLWSRHETETIINAGHESWYYGSTPAGSTVRSSGVLADKFVRNGRQFLVLETRSCFGPRWTPLVLSRTTLMVGGVREKTPGQADARPRSWARETASKHEEPTEVKQRHELVKDVTSTMIVDFEQLSMAMMGKDPSKTTLHTDERKASDAGLDHPIGSGMLTVAFLNELLLSTFGRDWRATGHLAVRFVRPVYAGDAVRAIAWEKGRSRGAGEMVELGLVCVNQSGAEVCSGSGQVTQPG